MIRNNIINHNGTHKLFKMLSNYLPWQPTTYYHKFLATTSRKLQLPDLSTTTEVQSVVPLRISVLQLYNFVVDGYVAQECEVVNIRRVEGCCIGIRVLARRIHQ